MTDAFRSEGFRDVSTYLVLRTGTGTTDPVPQGGFRRGGDDGDPRPERPACACPDAGRRFRCAARRIAGQVDLPQRDALFVTDVDTVHEKAVAAGAKEISGPVDHHEYGEHSTPSKIQVRNHSYIAEHSDLSGLNPAGA